MKVLVLSDDQDGKDEATGNQNPRECQVEEVEESSAEMDTAELSLNTVVGFSSPGTLKVRGRIEDREVVILIDCGATHNFISQKLVNELKLPVSETLNYGIIMGTGTAAKGRGICKGVVISLKDLTIAEDYLPLELRSIDVILGMQWLRTLRVVTVDWKSLTLTIDDGDSKVIIKGDPTLTKTEMSLKRLQKTWNKHDEGFLVEMTAITALLREPRLIEAVPPSPNPPVFDYLLEQYDDVFALPSQLPPSREVDHRICLKDEHQPVNARPYRYAHAQKEEIERMIREM